MRTIAPLDSLDPVDLYDKRPCEYGWGDPMITQDGKMTSEYEEYFNRAAKLEAGFGLCHTHMQQSWWNPGYMVTVRACYGVPLILATLDDANKLKKTLEYRYPMHVKYSVIPAVKAWDMCKKHTEILTGRRKVKKVEGMFGVISYVEESIDETKLTHKQAVQQCIEYCKRNRDKEMQKLLEKASAMYKKPEKPSSLSDAAIQKRADRKSYFVFDNID